MPSWKATTNGQVSKLIGRPGRMGIETQADPQLSYWDFGSEDEELNVHTTDAVGLSGEASNSNMWTDACKDLHE